MIAVDSNLLVYAHRKEASEHKAAHMLVQSLAEGERAWAIPWPCCCEFLGISANRRIRKDGAVSPGYRERK